MISICATSISSIMCNKEKHTEDNMANLTMLEMRVKSEHFFQSTLKNCRNKFQVKKVLYYNE